MSLWPSRSKKEAGAPVAPAPPPACVKCQGDEFVILSSAGRLGTHEGCVTFSMTRARLACAHCLATYTVRLDRPEIRLSDPGPSAGSPALMALEDPAPNGNSRRVESPTEVPDSVEALLSMLGDNPTSRMGE